MEVKRKLQMKNMQKTVTFVTFAMFEQTIK